jgi:Holliday junction resolvase RusA-like endonuclease
MKVKLVLPVPTSLNRLYINQATFNPKTKQYIPTGKRILSKDGMQTKAKLQGEARVQFKGQEWDFEKTKEKFIYQDVVIHFARRGTDADNIFKLLNDSMQGIIYDNDCMVLSRVQKIVYNPKNPHIEVEYTFSDFIGIFDNKDVRDEFEARCEFGGKKGCSKYRNGKCSILQDSLIGTVREEIGSVNSPHCTSFTDRK